MNRPYNAETDHRTVTIRWNPATDDYHCDDCGDRVGIIPGDHAYDCGKRWNAETLIDPRKVAVL